MAIETPEELLRMAGLDNNYAVVEDLKRKIQDFINYEKRFHKIIPNDTDIYKFTIKYLIHLYLFYRYPQEYVNGVINRVTNYLYDVVGYKCSRVEHEVKRRGNEIIIEFKCENIPKPLITLKYPPITEKQFYQLEKFLVGKVGRTALSRDYLYYYVEHAPIYSL